MNAVATLPHSSVVSGIKASVYTEDRLKWLRLFVFTYFALWVFEGVLRKWLLPGLSGPLLLIRDPILLLIYGEAIRQKAFKFNGWITFMVVLGTLSTIVGLGLVNPPSVKILIFGMRANFLHLPLIFILPQIIDYRHVKRIGSFILWFAPAMTVLATAQFMAGVDSFLNVGAGGEGKMIETALGRIRPSGTYTFTNGLAQYTVLLAAFLFHHILERNVFSKLAFIIAPPCLLVLVLVSGSRTTFALVILQVLTVFAIWMIKPRFLKSSLKLFALGFVVFTIVGSFGVLKVGLSVILERFGDKKNVQEGFIGRFVDEFKKPVEAASKADIAGVGIGMGTNAASSMMYKTVIFNFGESELDRIIMEMGPVLGFPYLFWRGGVVILLFGASLAALRKNNNTLPLLLTVACANDVIQGQFGQTTILGFAVMTAGFAFAAIRKNDQENTETPQESDPFLNIHRTPLPVARISPYAAALHSESLAPVLEEKAIPAPSPDKPKKARTRKTPVPKPPGVPKKKPDKKPARAPRKKPPAPSHPA